MITYITDITKIYHDKNIDKSEIKILTSDLIYDLSILDDFPNIEEVLCWLKCSPYEFDILENIILNRKNLKIINLFVVIPGVNIVMSVKKLKIDNYNLLNSFLNIKIPKLLKSIDNILDYLSINFFIVYNNEKISVTINRGIFESNSLKSINILKCLKEIECLKGIIVPEDLNFNLDINPTKFKTIVKTKKGFIDIKHFSNLFSKSTYIEIIYNSETFEKYKLYSDLIRDSCKNLTRLKAIIRLKDVEFLLNSNKDLKEVHVLIKNFSDAIDLSYIMECYDQEIIYYVYYYNTNDEYWKNLYQNVDIILIDIVKYLNFNNHIY